MAPNALQGLLKALADPEADPNLRRRALRAYGLFLLGLKGGLLLLLAPFLPSAPYPPLLLLAVLGVAWLYLQARSALEEEAPLGPLVAVGLGAAAFFFLGVLGLLLRPLGLLLLPLGLGAFWGFLRRGKRGSTPGQEVPKPGPRQGQDLGKALLGPVLSQLVDELQPLVVKGVYGEGGSRAMTTSASLRARALSRLRLASPARRAASRGRPGRFLGRRVGDVHGHHLGEEGLGRPHRHLLRHVPVHEEPPHEGHRGKRPGMAMLARTAFHTGPSSGPPPRP